MLVTLWSLIPQNNEVHKIIKCPMAAFYGHSRRLNRVIYSSVCLGGSLSMLNVEWEQENDAERFKISTPVTFLVKMALKLRWSIVRLSTAAPRLFAGGPTVWSLTLHCWHVASYFHPKFQSSRAEVPTWHPTNSQLICCNEVALPEFDLKRKTWNFRSNSAPW